MQVQGAEELQTVSSGWDDLDTSLMAAVNKIAKGPVQREITMYREDLLQRGLPMSGRSALWILLRRFHIDMGQTLHVDLNCLMQLKFEGDLELFLDSLDHCLKNMS